jgi:hypothetical protein
MITERRQFFHGCVCVQFSDQIVSSNVRDQIFRSKHEIILEKVF